MAKENLAPEDSPSPVYLFYRFDGAVWGRFGLPAGYQWRLWKPSLREIAPSGVTENRKSFVARWIMHHLRLLSNRDYRVLVIRKEGRLVHYSGVTGRYFRWPFMNVGDVQVGRTWTDVEHRGKGLATFALSMILGLMGGPGRAIWYVCAEENRSSIAVAERCGMVLIGKGGFVSIPALHFGLGPVMVIRTRVGTAIGCAPDTRRRLCPR